MSAMFPWATTAPHHLYEPLEELLEFFEGEILFDEPLRRLYATDASAYRVIPLAVAYPKHKQDIRELVLFARKHNTSIIPRAAGTSLAGQVVGNGIVMDVSRYMNRILEINPEQRYVWVEPGVVRDELNLELKKYGLFFGPETSTSNRAMIGGMVGNNACGAHSLVFGSTRDHLLELEVILFDGSIVTLGPVTAEEFHRKKLQEDFEGDLYRNIWDLLSDPERQESIRKEFPHPSIKRRNTGYALDLLLDCQPFNKEGAPFNFCRILAGSEGTLAMISAIKLSLSPLPPPVKSLVCVHCQSLEEAFEANLIALEQKPVAVELMDKAVLDLGMKNPLQAQNRFFVQGDPAAILAVEFNGETQQEVDKAADAMEAAMKQKGMGLAFPRIYGQDISRVWAFRKAGLGLLSNMPGDARPVPVVEDTAVRPEDLPAFIAEFRELLGKLDLSCVFYAHIGTGELHLRPVLNLKDPGDVKKFRTVAEKTARLVKKYRGSLSGEHGDGRLRGEFIPEMIGEENYIALRELKRCWDPENIFNPGKITDTPAMDSCLRFTAGTPTPEPETIFDFSLQGGFTRAAEKCNGSGDCRKSHLMGGTMCPSYQATRKEENTTRARANLLRELIYDREGGDPFSRKELYQVLDLCLSCKACKKECPSNVDMAKLKAEFLQHYYEYHGIPLRTRLIAHLPFIHQKLLPLSPLVNLFFNNQILYKPVARFLQMTTKRKLPGMARRSLQQQWNSLRQGHEARVGKRVFLFADEFTDYLEPGLGITVIRLLESLGWQVSIPQHTFSGRTFLSKGLLKKARDLANSNVEMLSSVVSEDSPLIGVEPSTILSFRDEYPELVSPQLREQARQLAKNTFTLEEFLASEINKGTLSKEWFTDEKAEVLVHGHCQQKAVSDTRYTLEILSFPENYSVMEIPSGCCGMAGSFGYEAEHYDLSMAIGEMVLFPAVREAQSGVIIAAAGTSCRHQIHDGTGKEALHPAQILWQALRPEIRNQ
ncbi:MAG: FAD-binding and (Fe-S)-binding domain-containing protein [Bacteroidales bacterium]